ncbi:MAG: hypothetical protein L3J93_05535 [Thermoplasmata archaeon]|nr:hypothetical protein [Thermoplasmata archaeon]
MPEHPAPERESPGRLETAVLLHLLTYRGNQVRFEADQRTTEFGILRAFPTEDATEVKYVLRRLELSRYVYRRIQYVIGYSEPKPVFALTPSGHRLALDLGAPTATAAPDHAGRPAGRNGRRAPKSALVGEAVVSPR